jgi:predicted DNA-binding transcriptional regulator AlpA
MLGANERPRFAAGGVVGGQLTPCQPTTLASRATSGIEPMLSVGDLMAILGCSRRLIEQMRSAGKFPRPTMMLGRMPRWRAETIRTWIERGGAP